MVVWAISVVLDLWEEWREAGEDDDEPRQRTVAEETQHAGTSGESDTIAQYFGVPGSEFERWPERWQRALKRVHASPEKFRKRTVHTLKMFDASDWVLVEKMAPYALGGHLLAEGFLEAQLIGIKPDDQVELEAMGLVNSGDWRLVMVLKPRSETELYRAYVRGGLALILWFRDYEHEVTRSAARITRTGREILRLLRARPATTHLHRLGGEFAKEGIRTELWEVTEIPGTSQFSLDQKLWEMIPSDSATE